MSTQSLPPGLMALLAQNIGPRVVGPTPLSAQLAAQQQAQNDPPPPPIPMNAFPQQSMQPLPLPAAPQALPPPSDQEGAATLARTLGDIGQLQRLNTSGSG